MSNQKKLSLTEKCKAIGMLAVPVIAALTIGLSTRSCNRVYNRHNHQISRIERTLYDGDNDGRYESGTIRQVFKDGCIQEEQLPWYATGKTKNEYERMFGKIDNIDSLSNIEHTLTFQQGR